MVNLPKEAMTSCSYSYGLLHSVLSVGFGVLKDFPGLFYSKISSSFVMQALGVGSHLLHPFLLRWQSGVPCLFLTAEPVVGEGRDSFSPGTALNLVCGKALRIHIHFSWV